MTPLFISHGSPMTALEPGAAGAFMQQLGPALVAAFVRPKAIVAVSAHSLTREVALLAAPRHEAVYDFGGFDPKLYTLRYDAPGAPDLAPRVQRLLTDAGIASHLVGDGGLDHGIWTPLRFMFPVADIPVLPLAWSPQDPPARLFALGQALAPLLDDDVVLLATGSITHNLRLFASGRATPDAPEIAESRAFRDWWHARASARDWEALFDYRAQAPHAVHMHPSDEHLLPWFVAAGAGGRDAAPRRLHDSVTYGMLGMDAYAFGAEAPKLENTLTSASR
jgi:4,5-DOPA dioxygenase extradiol